MGGRGCFNEQALNILCERGYMEDDFEKVFLYSTKGVLSALELGEIDYGIFGIYNNNSGLLTETLDEIGRYKFQVITNISMSVQHHILALPGTKISDISSLVGHEAAIRQCRRNLVDRYPGIALAPGEGSMKDGAGAAQALTEGSIASTTAILSGQATADAYKLEIIAKNLADDPDNTTTFLFAKRLSDNTPQ